MGCTKFNLTAVSSSSAFSPTYAASPRTISPGAAPRSPGRRGHATTGSSGSSTRPRRLHARHRVSSVPTARPVAGSWNSRRCRVQHRMRYVAASRADLDPDYLAKRQGDNAAFLAAATVAYRAAMTEQERAAILRSVANGSFRAALQKQVEERDGGERSRRDRVT